MRNKAVYTARGQRPPDRHRRRAQRLLRGDHGGVPADGGADLHRAPKPLLDAVRVLEGAQGDRGGAQADLPGRRSSGRPSGAGGLRGRAMGPKVPDHRPPRDPVLRLLPGHPPGDLHDQRDRKPQQPCPQDRAQQRAFPQRRGGHQTHLVGLEHDLGQVEKSTDLLACCQGATGHPIRRAVYSQQLINQLTQEISYTLVLQSRSGQTDRVVSLVQFLQPVVTGQQRIEVAHGHALLENGQDHGRILRVVLVP